MRKTRYVRALGQAYLPWIALVLLSVVLAACKNGGNGPGY